MKLTATQITNLLLVVIGAIGTLSFYIPYLLTYGVNLLPMYYDLTANISTALTAIDLIVAGVTFFFWMIYEARRLNMKHYWVYIVIIFCPAFAVAFPLFLFMRERRLRELSQL